MNTRLAICALYCFSVVSAMAQTDSSHATINLTQESTAHFFPDALYIELRFEPYEVEREQVSIQQEVLAFRDSLRKVGIAASALQHSNTFNGEYEIVWQRERPLNEAYYILKVANLNEARKAFEIMDNMQVPFAHIAGISHSGLQAKKDSLEVATMQTLKQRADALPGVVGQKRGGALSVSSRVEVITYKSGAMGGRGGKWDFNYEDQEVLFDALKLQCRVRVEFAVL